MNLIVDIGNTRTKVAFVEGNSIEKIEFIESINIPLLQEKYCNENIIISSVKNLDINMELSSGQFIFDNKTSLPIKNEYKSRSVGMDRLAAAVGAFDSFPNENCLIIDMGSAITIDFLTEKAIYKGGVISLGMSFRFQALHNFTSKLPLIDEKGPVSICSDNTEEAIRSGVVNSILFELESYINIYKEKYPNIKIILTGGDSKYFAKQFKNRIFADENLVLLGLNRILNYNVDKI